MKSGFFVNTLFYLCMDFHNVLKSVSVIANCLKKQQRYTLLMYHLLFSAIEANTDSIEDLMQRFQDSFRVPNTPTNMPHYQHAVHSSSTGRRRVSSHTRGKTKRHLTLASYLFTSQVVLDWFCEIALRIL